MNDKAIQFAYRSVKKVVIGVVGATVLLVGIALLVLPGPAFVVIPAGLAILAIEFAWAKRWLAVARRGSEAAVQHVQASWKRK